MQRGQSDEEEGDGKPDLKASISVEAAAWSSDSHYPRQSQHIYRRPHTEQDVPRKGCDEEDGSNDVQVGVRLRVVSS